MSIGGHQSARMGSDVWLTPPHILRALGPFDLDPCAPLDRPWDTARHHYTIHDDGLSRPWVGRVWLNPPYSRRLPEWIRRMAAHQAGTALVFARTETSWFHESVWGVAAAALFLRGRLHFHRVDGSRARSNAGAPSVLVAYGDYDAQRLAEADIPGQYLELKEAA